MTTKQLREVAEKATQGFWLHTHIFAGEEIISMDQGKLGCIGSYEDATHIATFSPATVLKLLEILELQGEALAGILEIGKRNLMNPKYDGYFITAHETRTKTQALMGEIGK